MEIPNPDRIDAVADWVELRIACTRRPISKAHLAKHLQGATGEDPDESFLSDVWVELRRRQGEYKMPPFSVLDRNVKPTRSWKNVPGYLPCLFFSVFGGSEGLSLSAKIFERIAAETLHRYFGLHTKIFGWPVDATDPKDIESRARGLARTMNERFVESPDEDKKDDTLDLAAWRPFQDRRSSQIVILMQCGIGKKPEEKANTLRLRAWEHYIHWGARPVPGFAVPSIIHPKRWTDLAHNGELLLDRIRIYNTMCTGARNKNLAKELNSWCKEHITKFIN